MESEDGDGLDVEPEGGWVHLRILRAHIYILATSWLCKQRGNKGEN